MEHRGQNSGAPEDCQTRKNRLEVFPVNLKNELCSEYFWITWVSFLSRRRGKQETFPEDRSSDEWAGRRVLMRNYSSWFAFKSSSRLGVYEGFLQIAGTQRHRFQPGRALQRRVEQENRTPPTLHLIAREKAGKRGKP